MAETVEALNLCCVTTRAKVERIKMAIDASGMDHEKFSVHALRLHLKNVDAAYDEYNSFQNRIYLTDPSKKNEYEPRFIDFEELYEFVRIALCQMLQMYEDNQKVADVVRQQERERHLLAVGGQPGVSNMPTMARAPPSLVMQQTPLPTFDGHYEHWFKFKARFRDIVDKCVQDSPATKLHFLDKALVGEAKGVIDEQTLNDNNYEGAWKILTDHFENLPMVIHGHAIKLLNLKPMVKESSQELKTLIDDCTKRVESLQFHDLKMDKMAEAIIIPLLTSKLDPATRKTWELSIEHGKLPMYKDTIAFLRNHCRALERLEQKTTPYKIKPIHPTLKSSAPTSMSKTHTVTVQKTDDSCLVCGAKHQVAECEVFKRLGIEARYGKAKQLGLCYGCLKRGHRTATCKRNQFCSSCSRRHHDLLHQDEKKFVDTATTTTNVEAKEGDRDPPLTAAECSVPFHQEMKQILLATAVVKVFDQAGEAHNCRVLLDSGAMANFMSESTADLLGLCRRQADVPIVGVNGMRSTVKFIVNARAASRSTGYEFSLDYLVVPKVTGALPVMKIFSKDWPIPDSVVLADPRFHDPGRIDMLVGAEVFFRLLLSGKIVMSSNLPVLQESYLGWLISGPVASGRPISTVKICSSASTKATDESLNDLLKKFWAIDDQQIEVPSSCDDACELHFMETHERMDDGRYKVMLPFRENVGELGESLAQAVKRFEALERRLYKHPDLKQMYETFIDEYLALGHARVLSDAEVDQMETSYFLPRHCVMKPDSSTTKLRVVFDASAKTSTDLSLNDVMMIGPTVQDPIFDIILRFRLLKYAFSADVPKMYRQVMLHEAHWKYQLIVWRKNRDDPLKVIQLKTVTYGTAAAPYLATRSIVQLAQDERNDFPAASETIRKSFYIDDVLSGANTLDEAVRLQQDLITLLARGGFELHKRCANDERLLQLIPEELREKQMVLDNSDVNKAIKTLGIWWDPKNDHFLFSVKPINAQEILTKRMVLSETAKLFDPLGLLAPVVVVAKMMMQRLWHDKLAWDDPVSEDELRIWKRLRSELCQISALKIERCITVEGSIATELHGFSDASKSAYGCCIYLKSLKSDGSAEVRLVCGKSRVAPLKELQREEKPNADEAELTIPRLELCAALLLAEQMNKVRDALSFNTDQVVLWTDSKIVICWIRKMKSSLPVFVKNRVTKIRQLFPDIDWQYVSTKSNPADIVSRGVFPSELIDNELWWFGPNFLQTNEVKLLEDYSGTIVMEEQNLSQTVTLVVPENRLYDIVMAHSNFRKLQRIFAYIIRFINNCRARRFGKNRRTGRITNKDYGDATVAMVVVVQQVVFREEIDSILKEKPLKGKLRNLNPKYDRDERLLRVGGRIRNADIPKNQKHPMILPDKNHFTDILVDTFHREHLHVGLHGLLATLRQNFWPVNAKRTIHRILRRCIVCFKAKPSEVQQFMGDLPSCRVTEAHPFARTGVDYAGPFFLKVGRGKSKIKAYVSLFVCMATKAIHLELVTSLSTEGFLGALHRFAGRRGNPSEMYSDNGTNFRGADRELSELKEMLQSQIFEERVSDFCQPRGISWNFNPPKAPHQGGIWEANIKCMKNHLRKVLNESYMTYEEMSTLLIQIEAILNSRPLIQISDDPVDYEALSPGHFLVGRELTAISEPLYEDLKDTTLSRYQMIQKRKQSFWRRWSLEYISSLQKRSKWYKNPTLLKNGLLVIIKEDNLPSQMWKLGRIINTHPGKDGVIRVVTVRTARGIYRRPTTQIAVLPIDDEVNTTITGDV